MVNYYSASIFDGMPKWVLIVVGVVAGVLFVGWIISKFIKDDDTTIKTADGQTNATPASGALKGQSKIVGEHAIFSRWCPDNQPVIGRSPEQQKLVDKYFIVKNNATSNKALMGVGVIAMIVGVILAIAFFATRLKTIALLVVGLILVAIAVVMFIMFSKSKKLSPPSDIISHDAYEQAVKTKIKELDIRNKGLLHLGLDEDQVKEIEPLVFTDDEVIDISLVAYDSAAGKVHSSTQNVMLVYFTDEQLLVYKLRFDMCCNKQEEWTAELFYVDICDVSTYITKNVLDLCGGYIDYSTLKANIVATNSEISITMANDKTRYAGIQAMRQKIRERKMQ